MTSTRCVEYHASTIRVSEDLDLLCRRELRQPVAIAYVHLREKTRDQRV